MEAEECDDHVVGAQPLVFLLGEGNHHPSVALQGHCPNVHGVLQKCVNQDTLKALMNTPRTLQLQRCLNASATSVLVM